MYVFYKDILLYTYNMTIKIRKLEFIHFCHLILRPYSRVAKCASNVLYRAGSESHVAFGCHIPLVFSTLEQFLSLSDSCDLDTSENYTNNSGWCDVPPGLDSGLCILGTSTGEVLLHSSY